MRPLLLLLVAVCSLSALSGQSNRIVIRDKLVFLSGMNIAWDRFGNDVGDTPVDEAKFRQIFQEISSSGGNAARWWLQTNASNCPKFGDDGLVSGLGAHSIENVRKVLDIAEEYGCVISLCLLSFDLMQADQTGVNIANNKRLLETEEGLQAYIDNALIPLVAGVGDHPAIMCWEIFNEPEGMIREVEWGSWATESVSFENVQRFMNRTAGAIRRTQPGVLISSSCWNVLTNTDIEGEGFMGNKFKDSELIAAGGDPLGTLDFYQFHYYPRYFGNVYSPFHNPASHWKVDKPIVIGEFPAKGVVDLGNGVSASPTMTPKECYEYAYENGYAGAFSWTWTAHDGYGGVEEAGPGMRALAEKFEEDLKLP